MDLYARVRRACHVEGMSQRQAARVFGIDPKTVAKMLRFSVPPGYRRSKPPVRPKLDPLLPVIDRILEEDQGRPRKQRHTARRIFERLKAEHGFTGGETIVKDYVRERRLRGQEMFVPLVHPPGHGQADFGEAVAVIGGVEQRIHFLAVDLPHSDAQAVRAILLATATMTSMRGLRASMRSSQEPAGGPSLSALHTTALAPMISSRRSVRSPIFDVAPSFCLPPVECCSGVRPAQAAKSRPLRNASAGGANAAGAVAVIGPTPGMVVSR